jgi:hypothetical protein
MNEHDSDRIDPALAVILNAEKPLVAMPSEVHARVHASVHAKISAVPGAGGNSGGSDALRSTTSVATSASRMVRNVTAIGTIFVAGGITGAAIYAKVAPERVSYVDRVVTVTLPSAIATTTPAPTIAQVSPPPQPTTSSHLNANANTSANVSSGELLAAERALLDVARVSLSQGDAPHALEAIARHEKQFPAGLLVEEREALAIRALAVEGRNAEARARAVRFEQRYPESLALPSVRAAVQANP